jgi:hypothetical protein
VGLSGAASQQLVGTPRVGFRLGERDTSPRLRRRGVCDGARVQRVSPCRLALAAQLECWGLPLLLSAMAQVRRFLPTGQGRLPHSHTHTAVRPCHAPVSFHRAGQSG